MFITFYWEPLGYRALCGAVDICNMPMYLFLVWNKESKNSITFTHFGQPFDFIAENVIKNKVM